MFSVRGLGDEPSDAQCGADLQRERHGVLAARRVLPGAGRQARHAQTNPRLLGQARGRLFQVSRA